MDIDKKQAIAVGVGVFIALVAFAVIDGMFLKDQVAKMKANREKKKGDDD